MSIRNFIPSEDNKESLGIQNVKWNNVYTHKINDFSVTKEPNANSIVVANNEGKIDKDWLPYIELEQFNNKIEHLERTLLKNSLMLNLMNNYDNYDAIILENFDDSDQIDLIKIKVNEIIDNNKLKINNFYNFNLNLGYIYILTDFNLEEEFIIDDMIIENNDVTLILNKSLENSYLIDDLYIYRTTALIHSGIAIGASTKIDRNWKPKIKWKVVYESDLLEKKLNTNQSNINNFDIVGSAKFINDYVTI